MPFSFPTNRTLHRDNFYQAVTKRASIPPISRPYQMIRMGRAIVPVRIGHRVVQIHRKRADMQTVVAVATDMRKVAHYIPFWEPRFPLDACASSPPPRSQVAYKKGPRHWSSQKWTPRRSDAPQTRRQANRCCRRHRHAQSIRSPLR